MSDNTFSPGLSNNTVKDTDGKILTVPDGWILLAPGDAALTRRARRKEEELSHEVYGLAKGYENESFFRNNE